MTTSFPDTDGKRIELPAGVTLVVGLGISGRAIARHLERLAKPFVVADSRQQPPGVDKFREAHPDVALYLGDLTTLDMTKVDEVIVSPGVDPHQVAFNDVRDRMIGELELFTRDLPDDAQVIAITGSNAKSTVTTLVGQMAADAGIDVGVGGNLGTPALTLLENNHALYVIEASSFQLEMTRKLAPTVACFLNLSEDHLDRHGDLNGYRAAKMKIFNGAKCAVINSEDSNTWPQQTDIKTVAFTSSHPKEGEWGILESDEGSLLARGSDIWVNTRDLKITGIHNYTNALASLAIGHEMGWPRESMLSTLVAFKGLSHRAEFLGQYEGIGFINDSKGTNVGASLAAINGIAPGLSGKLIWLGGGVGKGQNFSPLFEPLKQYASHVVLFGQDASVIQASLSGHPSVFVKETMQEASELALSLANAGDAILLSPACASLDQFKNYQERGDIFRAWFTQLGEVSSSNEKE